MELHVIDYKCGTADIFHVYVIVYCTEKVAIKVKNIIAFTMMQTVIIISSH